MKADIVGVSIIMSIFIGYMFWYGSQVDKMMLGSDNKPCAVDITRAIESGGITLDR